MSAGTAGIGPAAGGLGGLGGSWGVWVPWAELLDGSGDRVVYGVASIDAALDRVLN